MPKDEELLKFLTVEAAMVLTAIGFEMSVNDGTYSELKYVGK